MSVFRVCAPLVMGLLGLLACAPQAPRLDGVDPQTGDAAGGAALRIEGAGFVGHGPAVVYLGMRSARSVVIVDDRLITVVTPEAEALGPADLRLEFADGTRFDRPQAYDYTSADGTLTPIPFVPGATPVPTAE